MRTLRLDYLKKAICNIRSNKLVTSSFKLISRILDLFPNMTSSLEDHSKNNILD